MGRQNIKGNDIWYRRIKTGQDVRLPPALRPELRAELRQVSPGQLRLFSYTVERLGSWFAYQCKAAGLPDECRAHGLRKYGATRLAERGANEFQIMAFLAHKTTQEEKRYVAAANRVKLATDALAHLAVDNVQQLRSLDKSST